jgi:Ca2+-binding EF-hand superfamily protein
LRGFSEEQYSDFKYYFEIFSEGGEVPVFRFHTLCWRVGFKIPSYILDQRMPRIDADGSGTISFAEFLDAARELVDEENEVKKAQEEAGWTEAEADAFRELFVQFDNDGSGSLDPDELVELCGGLGFKIPEDAVFDLMQPYDTDGEGTLDFCEFLLFLRDASKAFPKEEGGENDSNVAE